MSHLLGGQTGQFSVLLNGKQNSELAKFNTLNRIYILHKSVPFTEKRLRKLDTGLKGGFKEMEHQFRIGIFRPDIQDLTFSDVPLLPEIFLWNDQKVEFHLLSNRMFRKRFVNSHC